MFFLQITGQHTLPTDTLLDSSRLHNRPDQHSQFHGSVAAHSKVSEYFLPTLVDRMRQAEGQIDDPSFLEAGHSYQRQVSHEHNYK